MNKSHKKDAKINLSIALFEPNFIQMSEVSEVCYFLIVFSSFFFFSRYEFRNSFLLYVSRAGKQYCFPCNWKLVYLESAHPWRPMGSWSGKKDFNLSPTKIPFTPLTAPGSPRVVLVVNLYLSFTQHFLPLFVKRVRPFKTIGTQTNYLSQQTTMSIFA